MPDRAPALWTLARRTSAPDAQIPAYSSQFGARITAVENFVYDAAPGLAVQVNRIRCAAEEDAKAAAARLAGWKGGPEFAGRRGTDVFEIVGSHRTAMLAARHATGAFEEPVSEYEANAEIAPIESCDYAVLNDLFVAILSLRANPGDAAAKARAAELAGTIRFGTTLRLRTGGLPGETRILRVEPEPASSETAGACTILRFREPLPTAFGVPFVKVALRVRVRGFAAAESPRPGAELTRATPFWPSDDRSVTEPHRPGPPLKGETETPAGRLQQVLRCARAAVLKYGGPVGSRHGVRKAIELGTGRCWDFSDVFVTLCRADGIPARQVAGWI
ncbi:MAG: transglutaminase-like domain-containing protein, partial [Planctomycetes bacterium]|nr:transglutaminase-like domain-containing protein [Planctomycetota bacterium]